MDRLAAIVDDKTNQNVDIAKKGGSVRKKCKEQAIEICSSGMECGQRLCFITVFDVNVNMVQYYRCDEWYHAMCESVTPSDKITLSDIDYVHLKCSSKAKKVSCE